MRQERPKEKIEQKKEKPKARHIKNLKTPTPQVGVLLLWDNYPTLCFLKPWENYFMPFTIKQLSQMTGALPRRHIGGTSLVGLKLPKKNNYFMFLLRSKESYSDPAGHVVSVLLPKQSVQLTPRTPLDNLRVNIFCSCLAWLYWGSSYHSTRSKYKLPWAVRENRAPTIRDPDKNNFLCKHSLKVINLLLTELKTLGSLYEYFDLELPDMDSPQPSNRFSLSSDESLDAVRHVFASEMEARGASREDYEDDLLSLDLDNCMDVLSAYGLVIPEDTQLSSKASDRLYPTLGQIKEYLQSVHLL